mmetsp:Transcript_14104/g.23419  ORF Transcript_14104/g.23419 Transcript_14104/m.23419 type:complete len:216 (+) Transcript_14104:829-1476(+)
MLAVLHLEVEMYQYVSHLPLELVICSLRCERPVYNCPKRRQRLQHLQRRVPIRTEQLRHTAAFLQCLRAGGVSLEPELGVEALLLLLTRHAQHSEVAHSESDDQSGKSGERGEAAHPEGLHPKQSNARVGTEDQPVASVKKGNREAPPDSIRPMHREGLHAVINPKAGDCGRSGHVHHARQEAGEGSARRVDDVTAGSDGNEASQDAISEGEDVD